MCSCFKVPFMVMNWVADLSQKIQTLLDIEGVMTMQEDAFDYVEHQLQIVGNSIDNQFQSISANIEHQLQAIRANIQQYCSNSELNGSESVDTENMEQTALKSSACPLDLSGEKDSKPSDVENKNILDSKLPTTALEKSACLLNLSGERYSKPTDVENKNNKNSNLAATALKKSSCSLDLSGEKDSKPANVDNKNIKDSNISDVETENINPTAQESSLFTTESKTLKKLPLCLESIPSEKKMELARAEYIKKDLAHAEYIEKEREKYFKLIKSGNRSSAFNQTASKKDTSIPDKYSEESKQKKYVAPDSRVGKFVPLVSLAGPSDFKADVVIGEIDKKPTLDGTHATIDNSSQCSRCFKKFKSDSDKNITCEACAAKVKLIDQQEHEQPTPESEVIDNGLNLSEDESFETADFDCDSDWEII